MALNKMMLMALKALSNTDINVKKNYKVVRKFVNVTHPAYRRKFYKTWDHKIVNEEHEIPVRIFAMKEEVSSVILYFHGGGWVTGNIDTFDRVCANLAKCTGHTVVSVDYRLAPEHKFPAALNDCYCVAKEIYLNAKELFGVDESRITIMGDSAGANLAAAVSLMARERKEFQVTRQILIYPAVNNDFSEKSIYPSIRENGTNYFLTSKRLCDYMELYQSSVDDRSNPYFAPILADDLSGQPETLILTAEYDPLRDEGEAYGRKLKEFGNDVEVYRILDVIHGFFALPLKYQRVQEAYDIVRDYLYKKEELKEKHQNEKKKENEMASFR